MEITKLISTRLWSEKLGKRRGKKAELELACRKVILRSEIS
jgi:hypothetical protein